MREEQFTLVMRDGQSIHMYKWEPDQKEEAKGILQIVHGSCEHAGRYQDFAKFMVENGYIVYANDHRGHGLSIKNEKELGYFAAQDGWTKMVYDLHEILQFIKRTDNNLKIFMLGNSMGSFLVRHYAAIYGDQIQGLIAAGTAHNPRFLLKLGRFLADRESKKKGAKHRSKFLYRLSYGTFNRRFEPARTPYDWLTRDEKIVDQYLADRLCGFTFTSSAFRDMFDGLLFITDKQNIDRMKKNIPILLLSGKDDPVGKRGNMVVKAYKMYKKAGIQNVQMKLYDNMRHEVLNELGKEEVYKDLLNWLRFFK